MIATVAGFVLGRLRLGRWVAPFVFETRLRAGSSTPPSASRGTTASRWAGGTLLAFMMAVVAGSITAVGYLFNFVL